MEITWEQTHGKYMGEKSWESHRRDVIGNTLEGNNWIYMGEKSWKDMGAKSWEIHGREVMGNKWEGCHG